MKETIVARQSKIGTGLFTLKSIKKGSAILQLKGRIIAANILYKIGGKVADNSFRFGPETYLSPEGELGAYINHSCEPNSGIRNVKGKLRIFAIKDIEQDTELTFDYSTILGNDDI